MSQTHSQAHIELFTIQVEDEKHIPALEGQGRQSLQHTSNLLYLKASIRQNCGRRGENT